MHLLSGFSHFVSVSPLHVLCRHIWDLGGALQGKVQLWEDDRQRDGRTSLRGRIHCGRPLWGAYCITNVVDYSVKSCKPLLQELNCLWVWKDTTVLLCKPHTQAIPTTLTWEWHGSKFGFNSLLTSGCKWILKVCGGHILHTCWLDPWQFSLTLSRTCDFKMSDCEKKLPSLVSGTETSQFRWVWHLWTPQLPSLRHFYLPTDAKALLMCTGVNNDIIPSSCDTRLQYVSLIAIFHDKGMSLNLLLLSENSNDNLLSPFTPIDSTSLYSSQSAVCLVRFSSFEWYTHSLVPP